jgi:site-specific recombinase XerD
MGATSKEIADIDGHTNTTTTDIYTRSTQRELRAKINQL